MFPLPLKVPRPLRPGHVCTITGSAHDVAEGTQRVCLDCGSVWKAVRDDNSRGCGCRWQLLIGQRRAS